MQDDLNRDAIADATWRNLRQTAYFLDETATIMEKRAASIRAEAVGLRHLADSINPSLSPSSETKRDQRGRALGG